MTALEKLVLIRAAFGIGSTSHARLNLKGAMTDIGYHNGWADKISRGTISRVYNQLIAIEKLLDSKEKVQ